jgi:hypothetical protein
MADMTDHEELAAKLDALPDVIREAIREHEDTFVHTTPDAYAEIMDGQDPADLVREHGSLLEGQQQIINLLAEMKMHYEDLAERQGFMADVVLGPERESYDGTVTRAGGLQTIVQDINERGEIKTRLAPRDRVAVYVAAIGGVVAIIVAAIALIGQIFT